MRTVTAVFVGFACLVGCGTATPEGASADGGALDGDSVEASGDSASIDAATTTDSTASDSMEEGGDAVPSVPPKMAAGDLSLDLVTVLQGTTVPIVKANTEVATRNAPIIAGRDAVVRVFVSPTSGTLHHALVAHATVTTGGVDRDFTAELTLEHASQEAALDSTFDIAVPGDAITPDSELSLRVEDKSTATALSKYPAVGTANLLARSALDDLHIVLVPYRFTADGSNRLPDTSPASVKAVSDALAAMLPVPGVDITVHDVVDLTTDLPASGANLNAWLNGVLKLRSSEAPKSNVIYLGITKPGEVFADWCKGDCYPMLSPVMSGLKPSMLGGVLVWFDSPARDSDAANVAYSVGLMLGRSAHGPGSSGSKYPYANDSIGVFGYDRRTKSLVAGTTRDFMALDNPTADTPRWTSDYTFNGLFETLVKVNAGVK